MKFIISYNKAKMDHIKEIFADPEIHIRICDHLTFEEANCLRLAYSIPTLYSKYTITDPISDAAVIYEINDITARLVEQIRTKNIIAVFSKAFRQNDREMLDVLLKLDVIKNYKFSELDDSFLGHLADIGDLKFMEFVLKAGFDPNIKSCSHYYEYYYKDTDFAPIHFAIYGGNLDAVKMLIHYGASLNSKTKKTQSVIEFAIKAKQKKIVKYLKTIVI